MKQALTAGGLLSVWFESAKSALTEMGVVFEEDRDVPSLTGEHPELGKVQIEFFVPVQGKTRMEIAVDDPQLITDFKAAVIPAYKHISDLVIRQTKAEMAEEEKQAEQRDDGQAQTVQQQESQSEEADTETEKISDGSEETALPESSEEAESKDESDVTEAKDVHQEQENLLPEISKSEESKDEIIPPTGTGTNKIQYCKNCGNELRDGVKTCPKCGKKRLGGGTIALIIIGALILVGAIGFAAYYFFLSGRNQSSTPSTPQQSTTQEVSGSENPAPADPTVILVTVEQFNQVQLGMTYEQVCAVFGREGTFLEPETQVQNENGGVSTLRTYYWEAQGAQGANVCVTFKDGIVETISQFGLQ